MSDEEQTYCIVRFHFNGNRETIEEGLTLEEAKAHCNDPDSKSHDAVPGPGSWFDGFEEE